MNLSTIALGCLYILLTLILLLTLFAFFSPWPSSLLVRYLFRKSPETEPPDYKDLQAKADSFLDIDYDSQWNLGNMDIYTPKKSGEAYPPLIIWIHGGAFVASDKSDTIIYSTMLAANGYAVAAVNYSLSPYTSYPTALKQIAEAVEYLKSVSDTYNYDMNNVILAGDSAGANYAAQFYLSQTDKHFKSTLSIKQVLSRESIKGLMLYCGPYNADTLTNISSNRRIVKFLVKRLGWGIFGDRKWQEGSLLGNFSITSYTHTTFPPVFITDGNTGSFQQQGEVLAALLEDAGTKVMTLFFDTKEYTTGHEYQFLLDTDAGKICREKTLEFLHSLNETM